ncbi:membrane fusion protein, cobalt-zinc-cadmium efflux system [Singulisphaera sp. GP187]|uniref:efflux RND transporter periplasmic adaptor subunit n=1 Tax=Singulisphaera sp. GP187 TaxID=1882752 RepID=UPI000925DE46|nr:efflux RND transporter periplasmic adaptor subunit [Singulisphaera sp. GP187]SIN68551.1 membrane fusion protein, cobalt-zinc-cadmium efflux system [Singulisphaera sp. GP187]
MSRRAVFLTVAALLGVAAVAAVRFVRPSQVAAIVQSTVAAAQRKARPASYHKPVERSRAELVPDQKDALRLPVDVATTLGITTKTAQGSQRSRSLVLSGSLALDTSRLAHVHTRFSGEVVELGTITDPTSGTDGGQAVVRPIRFGDHVEKGQILAVLWSSDLGEKKSEYIEALSRVRMEKETLTRQETLFKDEATPERNLREARRAVESSQIAVARVERTLRSWRLSDAEIAAIRTESEGMHKKDAKGDLDREKSWARVELRAPLTGNLLEINLAVGDIVATDADLFKVADLSTLRVWAYVYEEDLPTLLGLPKPFQWTIRLKAEPSSPPIVGTAEKIGDLIDPNQHTALVVGPVENPDGRMRAGQFITAQVELPPEDGEIEIPIAALVEDGQESIVFIQPDPGQTVYAMRRVTVARRSGATATIRRTLALGSEKDSAEARDAAALLQPGDQVVTSGAVELRAALAGLQDDATTDK